MTHNKLLVLPLITLIILSIFGCSKSNKNSNSIKEDFNKSADTVITVSNVDELLDSIKSNTEIYLKSGVYNLIESKTYGQENVSEYYSWIKDEYEDGYELQITAEKLKLKSDDAEIKTDLRTVAVLNLSSCSDVEIDGITFGHSEKAEKCEGAVIYIEQCEDIEFENCRLYGCGAIGVRASNSQDIDIENCDIYDCSTSGFLLDNINDIEIKKLNFFDCGSLDNHDPAYAAFIMYGVQDADIKNIEIFNNYIDCLIEGSDLWDVKCKEWDVYDNHIGTAFNQSGDILFYDFNLENNVIDKWFGESDNLYISLDDELVEEGKLNNLWGDQLSSTPKEIVDPAPEDISYDNCNEVHVKTADEFLKAIASNTVIYLDTKQINLIEASDYPKHKSDDLWESPDFDGRTYVWNSVFDGYELCIGDVENLHIVGGELVNEPRYANILNFFDSDDITLESVKLGHTPEQGSCVGGVIFFSDVGDVIISNCDLYGCGVMGIKAEYSEDIYVENTLIHDCTDRAGEFFETDVVVFSDCKVKNCPEPHFVLEDCTNFIWNNKRMDSNSSFNVTD